MKMHEVSSSFQVLSYEFCMNVVVNKYSIKSNWISFLQVTKN